MLDKMSSTSSTLKSARKSTRTHRCTASLDSRPARGGQNVAARSLRLGHTHEEAEDALAAFLRRRRWLWPHPEAPLQLVRVLPPQANNPVGNDNSRGSCYGTEWTSRAASDICSSTHSSHGESGSRPSRGIAAAAATASFLLIRDDLLHPVLGGNKVRKLDALVPELLDQGATDVVTCGGVQSAHLAAVAVVAAEAGMRSHLLVRGERPQVPAGYHLVTRMYGTEVSYVSRAEYADRQAMLRARMAAVRSGRPEAKVVQVSEGGGDPPALLGLLRLVHWLACSAGAGGSGRGAEPALTRKPPAQAPFHLSAGLGAWRGASNSRVSILRRLPYPTTTPYRLVVDSGTGTTAIGLALGIALLGLPWAVHAVMLAGDLSYYKAQEEQLVRSFLERYGEELFGGREAVAETEAGQKAEAAGGGDPAKAAEARAGQRAALLPLPLPLPLRWLPRLVPRRFGKVLPGELETCKQIAQEYGIGLDPIYSLAAWEVVSMEAAADCAEAEAEAELESGVLPGRDEGHMGRWPDSARGGGGGARSDNPRVGTGPAEAARCQPRVMMLHGGGALGLHGLAQRFPSAL